MLVFFCTGIFSGALTNHYGPLALKWTGARGATTRIGSRALLRREEFPLIVKFLLRFLFHPLHLLSSVVQSLLDFFHPHQVSIQVCGAHLKQLLEVTHDALRFPPADPRLFNLINLFMALGHC